MADLIPAQTLTLVALFQGPLADVRFPDADANRLEAAVDALKVASASVARAEAELVAAREALAEKQRLVVHETERTLAYVRVYAADRPEIRAALETTPRPTPRRGRPKKSAATTPVEETAAAAE